MLRDSNNGAIGNWFCPTCHVENDYFQHRCTSCNKGEKDERCTIQSPKPLRTSSNMKNSWASQAKGGGANSNSNGSNANSPLPSSNSKPNLAASAASPGNTSRGGLSRSGGKNDKNDKNEIPSQPQKTPSNKNVAMRFEETVEIKRTLGDLSKSVSKNKLDPSKNVVAHYCKWDWLYCSGDCDTSDLYYSKVNLFHDLVDEEPVRAVVVLATVVYDDSWLEHVTVGLRSMGLLSEPMEKIDEQGSTAPTKSEKREKKKEYSQNKIEALRSRMEQNASISKNLQAMTPTKKKTNSKAQKVKISIYGGNDYDDYDEEEEDDYDDETPESGDDYYEAYDDSQGSGSEDWVKKQSSLTEEEQIARILQQELLEQQRLNPPPQPVKTNEFSPAPQAKPKSEPVPLTFAQMQHQKAKPQLNQKQQQKQPYVPPPKVTPVPTQPKPQNNANQQQQQQTQNGQKKQNNKNGSKDQARPGIPKNQNQNTKQQQKLKI